MDRRTFIFLTGLAALAGSVPVFLKPDSQTTSLAATTSVTIAQANPFQEVGRLSQVDPRQGLQARVGNISLVVIRDPANPNTLRAFNRRCPHDGCRVNWQGDQTKFVCPCHNAQFNAAGDVVRRPARSALQHYPVRVEGDRILVQVSA